MTREAKRKIHCAVAWASPGSPQWLPSGCCLIAFWAAGISYCSNTDHFLRIPAPPLQQATAGTDMQHLVQTATALQTNARHFIFILK